MGDKIIYDHDKSVANFYLLTICLPKMNNF
jgi:hypothetical protein